MGTVASGVYSPATFTPDRDRDYDAAGKARRASGFGGGLRLGKAHYDYEVPSDGVALKLSRNLNDIGVRSFILSGAPIILGRHISFDWRHPSTTCRQESFYR